MGKKAPKKCKMITWVGCFNYNFYQYGRFLPVFYNFDSIYCKNKKGFRKYYFDGCTFLVTTVGDGDGDNFKCKNPHAHEARCKVKLLEDI